MPDTSPIDVNLFAGAGGLAIGLRRAGFAPCVLYDNDSYACRTLRHNIESRDSTLVGSVNEGDVRKVDWRSLTHTVRLLAGGVPCQPFSLAGKHLAEQDGRNLFPEAIRAIRELHPMVVMIENVRGLLRPSFQPYFEYVLRQLECPSVKPKQQEGWKDHNERIRKHQCSPGYQPEYQVSWRLLDAADYGVAQNRHRIFVVLTSSNLPVYKFPAPTHSRAALIHEQRSGRYWDQRGISRPKDLDLCLEYPGPNDCRLPWLTVRDALLGLPDPAECEESAWMNHWNIPGARIYDGHTGSSLDHPSKTIKSGVHGVPGGENIVTDDCGEVRYYSLRETARLQSFPDSHYFEGARLHVTRQIGNAVPSRLAEVVALALYQLIGKR